MTKTKNRIYSFAVALFFVSVFFVGVDGVKNVAKADDSNAEWDSSIQTEEQFCDINPSACSDSPVEVLPAPVTAGLPTNDSISTDEEGTTDCISDAECQNDWGDNYVCNRQSGECTEEADLGAGLGYDKTGCDTENGYWDDSSKTCYTDKDAYCDNTSGTGYTWSTIRQKCTGDKGAKCIDNSYCAVGIDCTSNVCGGAVAPVKTPDDIAKDKKTASDAKVDALASSVQAQKAAKDSEAARQNVITSCAGGAGTPACIKATSDAKIAEATLEAAIAANKAAVEVANRAASVVNPATSSTGAGFSMCAGGILATVCRDANGNQISGTPYVAGISTGNYGGGGLPGNYSSPGVTTAKCGANFQDIGGVCFPTNTGLSDASITTILGRLFTWLMGLFTTLAVLAFVVSGIQYFMSSGDESMAEAAKDNAKNALIGIVVGLSGFIIIKAIAAALSGQSYFF